MISGHFSIAADHPALTGHFPGNPIVPGSIILERVLTASPYHVQRLEFAKFQQILRPAEQVRIDYMPARSGKGLDFSCYQGDRLVCSGRLTTAHQP
jgi:3-hydroxyacyl-[acyl-carrier-protein] dehydratase